MVYKDTGTLQYDIYFNDDQSECIVLERYRDSEALIEQAAHLGDLTEAILATGTKPGHGSYVCSKCGTAQELRTRGSTLKRCPNCRGTLFGKAKPSK